MELNQIKQKHYYCFLRQYIQDVHNTASFLNKSLHTGDTNHHID